MDNGVQIGGMPHVEENGFDDLVSGLGVEEKVISGLGVEEKVVSGSVDSVDLDGGDVFEEAVDTTDHLLKQGTNPQVGYGGNDEDGFVGSTSDSDLIAIDENSNVGHEVEKFEEATGDLGHKFEEANGNLHGTENREVASVADNIIDLPVFVKGSNDSETGGTSLIPVMEKNEVFQADSANLTAVNRLDHLEEKPSDGETVGGGTDNLVDGILDTSQGNKSELEAQHENRKCKDIKENNLATKYQNGDHVNLNFDPMGLKSHVQYEQVEEANDNLGNMVVEHQVDDTEKPESTASGLTSAHMAQMSEVLRDVFAAFSAEHEDNINGEVIDSSSAMTVEHVDNYNMVENARNDLSASVQVSENGNSSGLSVVEKTEDLEADSTELRDCNTEYHGGVNGEVNDSSAASLGIQDHDETCILEDPTNDLPVSMDETAVVADTGGVTSAVSPFIKSNNEMQEDTAGLRAVHQSELTDSQKENLNAQSEMGGLTFSVSHVIERNTEMQVHDGTASPRIVDQPKLADENSEQENPNTQSGSGGVPSAVSPLVVKNNGIHDGTTISRAVKKPALADENSQQESENARSVREEGIFTNSGEEKETALEETQNAKPEREREIQGVPQLASSSAISKTAAAPTPTHPAGLGRAAPLLESAPRAVQQPRVNGAVAHLPPQQIEDAQNGEGEVYDETREKLQMIRVKFLRLAHRLGQTPHNIVVAQVLYRLGLAEQLRGNNGGRVGAFSFDRASAMAEQLEAAGQDSLDFTCTIMVLGKTGVGKSATINSIFDEQKFSTDAFQMGTRKIQDVVGFVQGIRVRVIDTPGLLPSWSDQRHNEKILHSVKRFTKRTPPDIVLYLDRLDVQSRDLGDMPLLRTITEICGPSIWFNAIVVLTHAASAPPDGPNGTASSYDMFVTQRSHVVQQAIRQAAGDMRLMNPVSLVENHSACRTNRAGQRVLPNGQVWKPHLLLLSFASKILAEANELLKLQDSPPGRPVTRSRAPPLPFLLSSLLQSRPQVMLPEEQFGDEGSLDDDLDESSEDESEYDELPPFKRLTKAQIAMLTKAQRKAYFDELEYRDRLLMKQQLKEEKRRRKMLKAMAASSKDMPTEYSEEVEEETGGPASLPVPMPDLALPASFDSDNPTHRYRFLDSTNQWLVRPVLETHGWDHDVGYEGINVEKLFVVKGKIPVSFSSQVTKDKKDMNVQMEIGSSLKHGEGKATSLGFDMQTVGKDVAYTLRSESRFSNHARNKATAGISVTQLGDALSAGVKLEDKLILNKQFRMVVTGGAMSGRGDVAYGGSLEAQLRDKDYPLGRFLSTLGLSIMDWHGDIALGCNLQSQIPIGRSSNLIARANLNNRGSGQVSIRLNSSEQLQIALLGLIPFLTKVLGYIHSFSLDNDEK